MIKFFLTAFILGILFILLVMPLEQIADKHPDSKFTKWWRKNVVGRYEGEDF
jgi:hypothetical protein